MLNDFSATANIIKFKCKNHRGKSSNFVFKQRIFFPLFFCFRFRYQFKRFNLIVTFPVKADLKRLKFRLLKYSDFVMLKYNFFQNQSICLHRLSSYLNSISLLNFPRILKQEMKNKDDFKLTVFGCRLM
jgi:hypothetical protein